MSKREMSASFLLPWITIAALAAVIAYSPTVSFAAGAERELVVTDDGAVTAAAAADADSAFIAARAARADIYFDRARLRRLSSAWADGTATVGAADSVQVLAATIAARLVLLTERPFSQLMRWVERDAGLPEYSLPPGPALGLQEPTPARMDDPGNQGFLERALRRVPAVISWGLATWWTVKQLRE